MLVPTVCILVVINLFKEFKWQRPKQRNRSFLNRMRRREEKGRKEERSSDFLKKKKPTTTRLELARTESNGFRDRPFNHSGTLPNNGLENIIVTNCLFPLKSESVHGDIWNGDTVLNRLFLRSAGLRRWHLLKPKRFFAKWKKILRTRLPTSAFALSVAHW